MKNRTAVQIFPWNWAKWVSIVHTIQQWSLLVVGDQDLAASGDWGALEPLRTAFSILMVANVRDSYSIFTWNPDYFQWNLTREDTVLVAYFVWGFEQAALSSWVATFAIPILFPLETPTIFSGISLEKILYWLLTLFEALSRLRCSVEWLPWWSKRPTQTAERLARVQGTLLLWSRGMIGQLFLLYGNIQAFEFQTFKGCSLQLTSRDERIPVRSHQPNIFRWNSQSPRQGQ